METARARKLQKAKGVDSDSNRYKIRVVLDILPFFISSFRPDLRCQLPDIQLEKLFKIKNSFDK